MKRILQLLDVESLENLSATSVYFDQLIASKYLTSIDIPFSVGFIEEVINSSSFEKKPLLKLRCKKTRDNFKIFEDMSDEYSEPLSLHTLIVDNYNYQYMLYSQMSLLSLSSLKEVDLMPVDTDLSLLISSHVAAYASFDCVLLKQISRLGTLINVTHLDVLVDHSLHIEEFMNLMPKLIHLGLTILTRTSLSKRKYLNEYLPRLEAVIAASKAPVLKITVAAETKRLVSKVLTNKYVEKLVVKGPCTFNVFPVMERLKEVEVQLVNSFPDICTYWRSKSNDRLIHRAGLCCVNIGSVYKKCPNVKVFMGVEVGAVSHDQSFTKWNTRMKKKFYEHYHNQGGCLDYRTWSKTRWFKKEVVLPQEIGHNRQLVGQ